MTRLRHVVRGIRGILAAASFVVACLFIGWAGNYWLLVTP